jgi:hypothetical protein
MFGWGYGADLGGLSHQPDPNKDGKITYPFKSPDGRVTFDKQKTGDRTFDYNQDGVDHYGLYADWFNDIDRQGGRQLQRDMMNGAEAYIEMWERASGIRTPKCARSDGELKPNGFNRLRLGDDWVRLLQKAGQPQSHGRAWTYCVAGSRNKHAADVAELSPSGKVELVGSTALNRAANRVDNGQPASGIERSTHAIGAGIRIDRARSTNWVFAVRRGRVVAVAVASDALAQNPAALKAAMKRLLKAHGSQAKRTFIPNSAAAAARAALHGNVLAGASDPKLNAAMAYLCSMQLQAY